MVFPTLSLMTAERFLYSSSGPHFVIFLASRDDFSLYFILKQMAIQNNKTVQWKYTFVFLWIESRTTGHGFYQWHHLLIITPKIPTWALHPLSSIVIIILEISSKTNTIYSLDLLQPRDWLQNWENWWMYIAKTSCIFKTSRNKYMIKEKNFGTMHQIRKSSSIVGTSRWNKTENSKSSFFNLFAFYT